MIAIRGGEGVAGATLVVQRDVVVLIDATSAGAVHEEQLVIEARPELRQAVAADLTQIVDGALAAHAAAAAHRLTRLVDEDLVGEEVELLALAFRLGVAFDDAAGQLDREVVADGVAGFLLQVGLQHDRQRGLRPLAHHLARPIGLLRHRNHQVGRPQLPGFRVVQTHNRLCHVASPQEITALLRLRR
ncbi:hypothetical protein D3C81_1414650 [compost metagenome]